MLPDGGHAPAPYRPLTPEEQAALDAQGLAPAGTPPPSQQTAPPDYSAVPTAQNAPETLPVYEAQAPAAPLPPNPTPWDALSAEPTHPLGVPEPVDDLARWMNEHFNPPQYLFDPLADRYPDLTRMRQR